MSSLGEFRQSRLHPLLMSLYFKVHSVSKTDPTTATVFQPPYKRACKFLFMKFRKENIINFHMQSICRYKVTCQAKTLHKPSLDMMAALLTPRGLGGDLYYRYKRAISNTPGGWELKLLWNTVGPLPLWPGACKEHPKLPISAWASNSVQQGWFSRFDQLVLRFLHLHSVSYRAFFIMLDFSSCPETKIHSIDMVWRCLKHRGLFQTLIYPSRLGCIWCPPQFELPI